MSIPPKSPEALRVATVGSPLAFKGVREFIEAACLCKERGLAVEFLMVGSSMSWRPRLAERLLRAAGITLDVEEDVRRVVKKHGLTDSAHLQGFTPDIDREYASIDVLCFPSHLDAVGRPVLEAAFWKVPSIVAVRDPPPDTIVHCETGLCIEPGDPRAITEAISYFCLNRSEPVRMGEAAYQLALRYFKSRRNAARVLEVYRRMADSVKT